MKASVQRFNAWGMSYAASDASNAREEDVRNFVIRYKHFFKRLIHRSDKDPEVRDLIKMAKMPEHLGYAKTTTAPIIWRSLKNKYNKLLEAGLIT